MKRAAVAFLAIVCLALATTHLSGAEPEARIFFPFSEKFPEEFSDSLDKISLICGCFDGPVESTKAHFGKAEELLSDKKALVQMIEPVMRRAFPDFDQGRIEALVAQASECLTWENPWVSPLWPKSEVPGAPGVLRRGPVSRRPRAGTKPLRENWAVVRWSPTFGYMPEEARNQALAPGVIRPSEHVPPFHWLLGRRPVVVTRDGGQPIGFLWLATTEPHLGIDIVERITQELRTRLEEYEAKYLKEALQEWRAKLEKAEDEQQTLTTRREELENQHKFREVEEPGPNGLRKTVYVGDLELMTPLRELLTTTEARWFEHEMKGTAVQSQLQYVRAHLAKEAQVLQVPGGGLSPQRRALLQKEVEMSEVKLVAAKKRVDAGRAPVEELEEAKIALEQARARLLPQTVSTINPAWSALKQQLVQLEVEFVGLEAAGTVLRSKLLEQREKLGRAQEYLEVRERLRVLTAPQGEIWRAKVTVDEHERSFAWLTQPQEGQTGFQISYVVQIALPPPREKPLLHVDPKYLKPMRVPAD